MLLDDGQLACLNYGLTLVVSKNFSTIFETYTPVFFSIALKARPRLFKHWTALSTGSMDNIIHLSNNSTQVFLWTRLFCLQVSASLLQ